VDYGPTGCWERGRSRDAGNKSLSHGLPRFFFLPFRSLLFSAMDVMQRQLTKQVQPNRMRRPRKGAAPPR